MPAPIVFLSSATTDLGPTREEVAKAVIRANMAINVMTTFAASTDGPDITSISEVGKCDLFVGMIGLYYGTLVTPPPHLLREAGEQVSITELEYREAQRLSMRTLMYVPASVFRPPRPQGDPRAFRFIERIQADQHTPATYEAPHDLPSMVAVDLLRLIQQLDSGGVDSRLAPNVIPPGINAIHNGIRHLENENYQSALYDLGWAVQLLPRDATPSFLIALALLRGMRPKIHTLNEVSEVLRSLTVANNIRPTRIALGLQAAVEADYYVGNGFSDHQREIRQLEARMSMCRAEETSPATPDAVREELRLLNLNNLSFVRRFQPTLLRDHPGFFA